MISEDGYAHCAKQLRLKLRVTGEISASPPVYYPKSIVVVCQYRCEKTFHSYITRLSLFTLYYSF